jgi:hypothetical protein
MIKRLALLLVLIAAFAATSAARSQQPTGKASASPKPSTRADDSVRFAPSPELQKSLEDLAASMQALAQRIASDPQLRSDAMRVANGLVTTAQHVVSEQTVVLQGALKTAADRIAAEQSVQSPAPKNHR